MSHTTTFINEAGFLIAKGHTVEDAFYLKPDDHLVTLRFADHPDLDQHLKDFDTNVAIPIQQFIHGVDQARRLVRRVQDERSGANGRRI